MKWSSSGGQLALFFGNSLSCRLSPAALSIAAQRSAMMVSLCCSVLMLVSCSEMLWLKVFKNVLPASLGDVNVLKTARIAYFIYFECLSDLYCHHVVICVYVCVWVRSNIENTIFQHFLTKQWSIS